MESSESAIFQRDIVVQADEFHKHGADDGDKVFGVAGFVGEGHGFCVWRVEARAFLG